MATSGVNRRKRPRLVPLSEEMRHRSALLAERGLGPRVRAMAMLGALVLAPVLLLADIWSSPQLNIVHRHTRPSQGDPQGGIKNKEAPLHVSNVALLPAKLGIGCNRRSTLTRRIRTAERRYRAQSREGIML